MAYPTSMDAKADFASLFSSYIPASKRHRWTIATTVLVVFIFCLLFYYRPSAPHSDLSAYENPMDYVEWSRFAYVQYVTNSEYLCNSVMFFDALDHLSSRADRMMMYPSRMLKSEEDDSNDARLLKKARDSYGVKLVPIAVQHNDHGDATWADSFTKLLAFNQTQYSRVLSIDSDSILLQHMDELFLLPPVPVAMPRAYWLFPDDEILSSQVMLVEPSNIEFDRVMDRVYSASANDYDMEIVNYLYHDNALVLPHRPYSMLSGEFRGTDHHKYLGSNVERWDPAAAYSEAKLVHFSDWPLSKPWLPTPELDRVKMQPDCIEHGDGTEDCTARIIWNSLYTDFKEKRQDVCSAATEASSRISAVKS